MRPACSQEPAGRHGPQRPESRPGTPPTGRPLRPGCLPPHARLRRPRGRIPVGSDRRTSLPSTPPPARGGSSPPSVGPGLLAAAGLASLATFCRPRATPGRASPRGTWRPLSQGSLDVGRYRHRMVFRDHPKNQKEGGIQRDSHSPAAEPEPHPDAQQARGPALHPDSALRRQWGCRDTPLRHRDADKLPESSAPVQDGSGAQQPARPQRAVTTSQAPSLGTENRAAPFTASKPPESGGDRTGAAPPAAQSSRSPSEAARALLGEGLRKARSRGLPDPPGPCPGEGPLETRLLAVARKRIPPAPPQNAFSLRIKTAANFKFNNRVINA